MNLRKARAESSREVIQSLVGLPPPSLFACPICLSLERAHLLSELAEDSFQHVFVSGCPRVQEKHRLGRVQLDQAYEVRDGKFLHVFEEEGVIQP